MIGGLAMRILPIIATAALLIATDAVACDYFIPKTAARACHFATRPIEGLFDQGRDSIIEILGSPLKVTKTERPNPYVKGQVDVREHFEFSNTELWVLFLNADSGRPFPIAMVSSDPKLTFRYGIRVGTPSAKLREVLGEPDLDSQGRWRYGGENNDVRLVMKDGKLESVIWSPYQG
jgi:hypothetical protein